MPTMPKLLSCAEGHFWEAQGGDRAPACPVCGGAPESLPLLSSPDDVPAATPTPAAPPGPPRRPVIPGYEIVDDRGRTPTGVAVYLAKQELVPRTVLLKVVRAAEDRGQRAWGALRGEAAALGKLAHPNVVRLYDAGERNRELFYNAVEFVDGPTLAQKWSAKPLPFRQAAALVEVLARALQHAHDQGVVHRALRPAVVHLQLFASEGRGAAVCPPFCMVHSMRCIPRLADFGLARRPAEGEVNDLDLQQGMPCYLAPEQVWGRAKDIGPASDVYALGAILYELVSGVPPFDGPTPSETLDLIQSRPAPPPGKHRRGVPGDLAAVCRKCLEKQPRYRYRSAEALADDLRRYLGGRPVKARSVGLIGRGLRVVRRSPVAALLFVCTLALATTLAVTMLGPWRGRPAAPPTPLAVAARPVPPPVSAPKGDAETDYVRCLALAQRAALAGDDERARKYLLRCPAPQRQCEWYVLSQRVRHEAPARLERPDVPVSGLACSPDGRFVAAFGHDHGEPPSLVTVWSERGGPILRSRPGEAELTALAWGAGLASLVVLDRSGEVLPVGLGEPPGPGVRLREFGEGPPKPYAPHRTAAVSCTGGGMDRRLACVVDGPDVRVYNRLRRPMTLDAPGNEVQTLACCAERNYVAAGDRNGVIRVWDAVTGQPVVTLEGHTAGMTALAFGRVGWRLVSGGADGAVCIWDVADGREVLRLPGPVGGPSALACHPDGRRLVVAHQFDVELWGGGPP
jgi:hypothetical protein